MWVWVWVCIRWRDELDDYWTFGRGYRKVGRGGINMMRPSPNHRTLWLHNDDVYIYMYVRCVCFVCMCLCVCVCMHVCMYVCIYVYICYLSNAILLFNDNKLSVDF